MSGDPCECVFDHAAMMRRLISLLRESQNDCTDSDCTSSLGSFASGNGSLVLYAMVWGLLAMVLFFMRPSSMRSNGGQLEGKPREDNGEGGNNQPPAPDVN